MNVTGKKYVFCTCIVKSNVIYYAPFLTLKPFGRGAVVAQLTVNQLVAGSNPAARANLKEDEILNGKR